MGCTPAPWKAEKHDNFRNVGHKNGAFKIVAGETLICMFPWARTTGQMSEESEANARLIAAAPELLEALEDIVQSYKSLVRDEFDGTSLVERFLKKSDKAMAVIAKAKGVD